MPNNKHTEELKEQAHKEFDEQLPLSEWYCLDHTEVKQLKESVESFIDSLIDKTVQMTEERIVGVIESKDYVGEAEMRDEFGGNGKETAKIIVGDIISLITNKSDINK